MVVWAYKKKVLIVKSLFFATVVLFTLICKSFFFSVYSIPTGSMIPTLMIGDFVIVKRNSYGIRAPFTSKVYRQKSPKRGDVIAFFHPKNTRNVYIKRIIAISGDVLEIRDKFVYLNGKKLSKFEIDNDIFTKNLSDGIKKRRLKFYSENLLDSSYFVSEDHANFYLTNHKKVKIPKGKYFVMGDNRDYSYDSRSWGYVSAESILGKVKYVGISFILSLKSFIFRPDRIFKDIN